MPAPGGRVPTASSLLVALGDLRELFFYPRLDLVRFGPDEDRPPADAEVLEERHPRPGVADDVAQGKDSEAIDGRHRALGVDGVSTDGLDRVANQLDARGQIVAGREDVDHPAADAELAVLLHGVLVREARVHQRPRELVHVDVPTRPEIERQGRERVRRADARHERGGRRHHHARLAGGESVQRAGAGRCDAKVGREAAIRIDFLRRKRQERMLNLVGGRPLEAREEEAHVADDLIDVAVGGHDHHGCLVPRVVRGGGSNPEGLGLGCQAGHARTPALRLGGETRTHTCGPQQLLQLQRRHKW